MADADGSQLFRGKYRIPSARLSGWDYTSAGWYFVTICVKNRLPCLAEIVNGVMRLTPMGEIVAEEWQRTAHIRPNVALDAWVVMPDHFHALIGIVALPAHDDARRGNDDARRGHIVVVETPRRGVSLRGIRGIRGTRQRRARRRQRRTHRRPLRPPHPPHGNPIHWGRSSANSNRFVPNAFGQPVSDILPGRHGFMTTSCAANPNWNAFAPTSWQTPPVGRRISKTRRQSIGDVYTPHLHPSSISRLRRADPKLGRLPIGSTIARWAGFGDDERRLHAHTARSKARPRTCRNLSGLLDVVARSRSRRGAPLL